MTDRRRILLIISGGIAAYKTLDLIRRLRDQAVDVHCVLTKAAQEFVTPLSVAALSENKVHTDLFSLTDETEMGHIQLSRASDLIVVAPASADLLAKMAGGHANDLATTLLLATDAPVMVAPAMNVRMWDHPATQSNIACLKDRGVTVIDPDEGPMACGEFGPGRLPEVPHLVDAIMGKLMGRMIGEPNSISVSERSTFSGRHVVITSGPTHEPIDPVRYIANRSSGKQGHAIAAAFQAAGATVTLISGPTTLPAPDGVTLVPVESANDMMNAVTSALPADIAIFAAAVADWRVADQGNGKIKKQEGAAPPALKLVENPDVLKTIAHMTDGRPDLVIGFAAETGDVVDLATAKRKRKSCDWILANDVSTGTGTFGGSDNAIHLIDKDGVEEWPRMTKVAVAERLVKRVMDHFRNCNDPC